MVRIARARRFPVSLFASDGNETARNCRVRFEASEADWGLTRAVALLGRRYRAARSQGRGRCIGTFWSAPSRGTMPSVMLASTMASDVDIALGVVLLLIAVPWLTNIGGLQRWWMRRAREKGNVDDVGRRPFRWRLLFGLGSLLGLVLLVGGLATR